ncbi:MAG: TonB-dependent receptor family protein [Bacteroidia bacterium]
MRKVFISLPLVCFSLAGYTQQVEDTSKVIQLNQVNIEDNVLKNKVSRLSEVHDAIITSAKKNEIINVSQTEADLSINNTRQIFAKVPGVSIWENDGSGIQVGVATRGLSPNRSWEFNVRQNGYDISADVFGYPEAYYNPPMEAVEKIEVIRGAASLAFGPQFGGLLNYELKKGNPNKIAEVESRQTVGSYGLFNSYNAIGGTYKKLSYYAYFHHRNADGWRENSRYKVNSGYINLSYQLNSKMKISAEYTSMNYLLQQSGGLTDSLFNINHRQSFRSRNRFSTPWNVAALSYEYKLNENSVITLKNFALVAQRNSVGFLRTANVNDTINKTTFTYNNRQVDRDFYNNYGSELRYLQSYQLFNQTNYLAIGARYYQGNTLRKQAGIGTSASDFDLTIDRYTNGFDYARQFDLSTQNIALYIENMFKITNNLSITPGFRYENILNTISGRINTTAEGKVNDSRNRSIYLIGLGAQYNTSSTTNFYANYSQSFRPILYSELIPSATTDIIDPNLKDINGYNVDFGWRGTIKNFLSFDVGSFYMFYDNRIGTINQNGTPFRTNIGASVSKGIEAFAEIDPIKMLNNNSKHQLSLFASYAYIDAKYVKWNNPALVGDPNKTIVGKSVEYAPSFIARYGLTYHYKSLTLTYQLNQVGAVFTDANNTYLPNATATVGKIDGYTIMDATAAFSINKHIDIRAGVNNLTDEKYATRRAGGYPGPGLIPGNGRTYFAGIGVKF